MRFESYGPQTVQTASNFFNEPNSAEEASLVPEMPQSQEDDSMQATDSYFAQTSSAVEAFREP